MLSRYVVVPVRRELSDNIYNKVAVVILTKKRSHQHKGRGAGGGGDNITTHRGTFGCSNCAAAATAALQLLQLRRRRDVLAEDGRSPAVPGPALSVVLRRGRGGRVAAGQEVAVGRAHRARRSLVRRLLRLPPVEAGHLRKGRTCFNLMVTVRRIFYLIVIYGLVDYYCHDERSPWD